MKKPIKKLFFIGFCAVVSINIMGCNGCHHSQGTDNSTSSLPPISTPTSSPSKPTKALEDRVINSIQAGNLYDDMQQKIINVLKNLKKGEKNAMNNINRNTTLHGPILPVIVSAKVFANEDDEVQVIQFLGSIPGIELDKKDNEQETALGGAIENIRPKSVKALLDIGASKTKLLSTVYKFEDTSTGKTTEKPTPLQYAQSRRKLAKHHEDQARYDEIIILLER